MNDIIVKQMSLDYCCSEKDVRDSKNCFNEYLPLDGRRRFGETEDSSFLKIAVINGKLLVTGRKDIVEVLQEKIGRFNGAWFMDAGALSSVDKLIGRYGWQIEQVHEFFTADRKTDVCTDGYDIVWYEKDAISQFEDDERFEEAFAFDDNAPDVLGVSAVKNGGILGMAGASADSPYMWQIGINTLKGMEARGVGSMLVTVMKNAALDRGYIPYYGTAMSHIASQRVALKAGFLPLWTELTVSKK